MKLNGIDLKGRTPQADAVLFVLTNTDPEAVAALSGQTLIVTDDGGSEVERYDGFVTSSIAVEGDRVNYKVIRKLDANSEAAIKALEANVQTMRATVDATAQTVTEAKGAADEAKATAEGATATADEAKSIAEQAGTDPQVRAASVMYVNAQPLTNTQLADVRDLIEDFVAGAEYAKGVVRRFDGKYYRMAQDINSTTSTTYQPGTGTESLYTLIDIAPDGIRVWHAPTDATNSFALGELAHYPDAEGPVYVSGRNGNTSEPTTDEWWAIKED